MTALDVGFLVLIGQTWHHAIVAGIVQAQIGEFSFLLSVVGADAGVISDGDGRLVVAVTVLSLALSPIWVVTGRRRGTLNRCRARCSGWCEIESVAGDPRQARRRQTPATRTNRARIAEKLDSQTPKKSDGRPLFSPKNHRTH